MLQTLASLHSYLRYLLLALLVINIITTFYGWMAKRKFANLDDKLSLGLFISTHLQLTLGIIVYVLWVMQASPFMDMKGTMHDKTLRYYTVEHLTMMLIAIVLISLGRILAKKDATDAGKYRKSFLFFTAALVVISATLMMMPK